MLSHSLWDPSVQHYTFMRGILRVDLTVLPLSTNIIPAQTQVSGTDHSQPEQRIHDLCCLFCNQEDMLDMQDSYQNVQTRWYQI